ncbi:MAG: PspC domain-containing protein [Bacteroidia bacterium]|jgi:phage shock protein PspC (stress-responsive transcriptional regulator)
MEKIKYYVEKNVFGVCSYLGERFGISSNIIRMYFIYTSFITAASPVLLYLILAFWLNIKKYINPKRKSTWEL